MKTSLMIFLGIIGSQQLFIFISIIIASYFILKQKKLGMFRLIVFAIYGAILGLPLSYYFQSDMLKAFIGGISGYIKNFGDVLREKDLMPNVIIGVVVFALIGVIIGYFILKNENTNRNE